MTLNKKRESRIWEWIFFFVYLLLLALVMASHEPWFDEAQAWLIARDASLWDVLTGIPHYEGHPPFWTLLLMPLARSGVPYEIGIKSVNFLFAGASMGILIFRSPFPRLVRLTIPFSYFFFYQYGVISRPYSLMMLGFVLAAVLYRSRNEKPFRFGFALAVLCASSAYGIVISAGICLVWLLEILDSRISRTSLRNALRSRPFRAMVILSVFCAGLVGMIWPYPDTFGVQVVQNNSYIQRLIYMLFIAPGDAIGSSSHFADSISIGMNLQTSGGLVFGIFVNATLLAFVSSYRKFALLVVPYACLAVFGGTVYFSTHHIGIITMFYLFVLWACLDDKPAVVALPALIRNRVQGERDLRTVKFMGKAFVTVALAISLYWSAASVYLDIRNNYGSGKDVSSFLVEHRLADLKIASRWLHVTDPKTRKEIIDFNIVDAVTALPYFKKNIFLNFNVDSSVSFRMHRIDSEGSAMTRILSQITPDVWIDMPRFEDLKVSSLSPQDYVLVGAFADNTIFKGVLYKGYSMIYLRRDLLEQHPELTELNPIDYFSMN
jgi:hypothetical protein